MNLVIASTFVHYFMIYHWPNELLSQMSKAIRNFLWSCTINDRKSCRFPAMQGGLGIKSLVLFNKALLSKLSWKIMTVDSFIFYFLQAHFKGKLNKWFYLFSLILPAIHDIQLKIFSECFWVIVCNSTVRLWQDNWLGQPLIELLDL